MSQGKDIAMHKAIFLVKSDVNLCLIAVKNYSNQEKTQQPNNVHYS